MPDACSPSVRTATTSMIAARVRTARRSYRPAASHSATPPTQNRTAVLAFIVVVPDTKLLIQPTSSSQPENTAEPTITLMRLAPRTKRAGRDRGGAVESDGVGDMGLRPR